jgi:hypothetical protein
MNRTLAALLAASLTACGPQTNDSSTPVFVAPPAPSAPPTPVGNTIAPHVHLRDVLRTPWAQPPPAKNVVTSLDAIEETDETAGVKAMCTRTHHDVQRNYDDIIYLGSANSGLLPGVWLQGEAFTNGVIAPVPLRRSRACLYTDAPAANPVACVDSADAASLRQAVATLQQQIDQHMGPLTAQISFQQESTSSLQASMLAAGAKFSYSGPALSAGFGLDYGSERSRSAVTVTVALRQVLYTVSLADDVYATGTSFLAADLTEDEIQAQLEAGVISETNLPVYVKAVTYGRVLLFTITSSEVKSTDELRLAVRAAYLGASGDASLQTRYQSVVQTAQVRVLAMGGSQDDAMEAVRTGDFSLFFQPVRAVNAVPVSFRANYVGGTRPTATIGDALQFVEEDCTFQRRALEPQTQSWQYTVGQRTGGRWPVITGIDVQAGDTLIISGSGVIWAGVFATGCNGPGGWGGGWQANTASPIPGQSPFALIGRVGTSGWFMVGGRVEIGNAPWSGTLELGTNDDDPLSGDDCGGSGFTVRIERTRNVSVWR